MTLTSSGTIGKTALTWVAPPTWLGALSGVVVVFGFTVVHDVFISDIWFNVGPMLFAGALCGFCIAWSYRKGLADHSTAAWFRYAGLYAAKEIGSLLANHELKIVTAESCTGGLIASLITDVPGSSKFFLGGVVAYSNQFKIDLLGVPIATLEIYGAVSEETVLAMARGARVRFGADIAVSVTGAAGPGGGTSEKPVGLTWIGLSTTGQETARRFL